MKTITILNSMKSGYFMLVTCATLLFGVSACSSEEFGMEVPEVKKEWTKQELIEQALSRMPQTRGAHSDILIKMVTINKTVTLKFLAFENMEIEWGDFTDTTFIGDEISHSYSDSLPSHAIYISGPAEEIETLEANDNGLIYLDIHAPGLYYLDCSNNHLDSLQASSCPALSTINVENNDLVYIDITQTPNLMALRANNNRLRKIDVSKNLDFHTLELKNNRITDIDLTHNTNLCYIMLGNQPITTINKRPISYASFSIFPFLTALDISGIPFQSLDLSKNPKVKELNISETDITQLDVLDLQIESLRVSHSRLTNLFCNEANFENLYDLRIERTPLENNRKSLEDLVKLLPDRRDPDPFGRIIQGTLYTYSERINEYASHLLSWNWVINP